MATVIDTLHVHHVIIQSNTIVTHLDLSDNGLATEGAIAIATMMKENCYITHLVSHSKSWALIWFCKVH